MDLHSVIQENLKMLEDLTAYPELYYLKEHTKVFDSLNGFYEVISNYNYPAWKEFYMIAIRYIKYKCTTVKNSIQTWQSHLILLRDMGFITTIRLSDKTNEDKDGSFEQFRRNYLKIYAQRKEKNPFYRPENLHKVNIITKQLMLKANSIAEKYHLAKVNYSHIDKQTVIDIRGQQIANKLYIDARTIPQLNSEIKEAIVNAIKNQIKERGYTTKKEIFEPVYKQYCTLHIDKYFGDCLSQQQKQQIIQRSRIVINKYKDQFRSIVANAGYKYGPVTKDEAAKFGIKMNTWIIR